MNVFDKVHDELFPTIAHFSNNYSGNAR